MCISIRIQDSGPRLPPPEPMPEGRQLNFRVLGYAFFESTWGKGYATEACSALLDAYRSYCARSTSRDAPAVNYVEACLHPDNAGSIRVLEKLGFRRVGWGDEPEKVFYAGKWRDPGYWVYGMYV
jgi:RimJ/RimL family protein N-acetyltransferase